MPDDPRPPMGETGGGVDRLNSAIDRMLAGGPAPVLNDPELQTLLQLATRLRDELPHDLPDPVFRLALKEELTARGPALVPLRRQTPARFPYVAAASAIAAVMVAAVAVGSLGIWLSGDNGEPTRETTVASLPDPVLTATMLAFASVTPGSDSGSLLLTPTLPDTPMSVLTAESVTPTASTDDPPATAPTSNPTEVAPSTLTTEPEPTEEPTEGTQLASVPPVDAAHVEPGPGPAVSGDSGPPAEDVTYVLETTPPNLEVEGAVYRLAPPSGDPEQFVREVGEALGLDGPISSDAVRGQTVYHLFDDEGSFHWTPESGAFSLALAGGENSQSLTLDEAVAVTREWLASIGYPVDQLQEAYRAEPMDDTRTSWRLETLYASVPEVGFGHLLGVMAYVDGNGQVTEATGYWLDVTAMERVELRTTDEIWQAMTDGDGYWTGGGIVEGGGEFRADEMRVTYVLTRDPQGEIVLQPVVQTTGDFTTPDGLSSARISCFIRASRTEEDE